MRGGWGPPVEKGDGGGANSARDPPPRREDPRPDRPDRRLDDRRDRPDRRDGQAHPWVGLVQSLIPEAAMHGCKFSFMEIKCFCKITVSDSHFSENIVAIS